MRHGVSLPIEVRDMIINLGMYIYLKVTYKTS